MPSRPKNRNRLIANEAAVPRTMATRVEISPIFTESQSDERTSWSTQASWNQCSVRF